MVIASATQSLLGPRETVWAILQGEQLHPAQQQELMAQAQAYRDSAYRHQNTNPHGPLPDVPEDSTLPVTPYGKVEKEGTLRVRTLVSACNYGGGAGLAIEYYVCA